MVSTTTSSRRIWTSAPSVSPAGTGGTADVRIDGTGVEDLVIRLLEKMCYGRAGNVERTSASGDAGVDGIISQDPLGLDRIYVQAKRYALDRTVDRPRIHEFAGALLGRVSHS